MRSFHASDDRTRERNLQVSKRRLPRRSEKRLHQVRIGMEVRRERGPKDRDRNIRLTEGEFDRRAKTKEAREGRRAAGPHP